MSLNTGAVGKETGPLEFSYSWKDVILYALGIGAGNEDLEFVYEGRLKVYPTFAVLPSYPILLWALETLEGDLTKLLHAGHELILHHSLPPEGKVYTTGRIASLYDKGKHALATVEMKSRDAEGRLLFENVASLLFVGEGGFGGERGPSYREEFPSLPPDLSGEVKVGENLNLLYRLSGDLNPLHVDPEFARLAGFERPILHGLCTFGVVGRLLLRSLCDNDPRRFGSLRARFSGVVFPGDSLRVEGWKREMDYLLRVSTSRGVALTGSVRLR
ncbi:MAG: MaoC/PaaZ C-terminal domain-containing protein [Candidatus Hadarchaeales archaeon]